VSPYLGKEPAKKPRKLWRKPRKLKDTPHAWLRRLTCPFDFGVKVRDHKRDSTHPVHADRNTEILAAFRDRTRWRHVARLTNRMLDEHWEGRQTYYFVAAGSSRVRQVLINLDIDCHNRGSLDGAVGAAEYLKQNFFPGLYCEVSTNGNGVHGYVIVEKFGIYAEALKRLLKQLERALNHHLLAEGFDVELFEFKGLPPVVTWGGRPDRTPRKRTHPRVARRSPVPRARSRATGETAIRLGENLLRAKECIPAGRFWAWFDVQAQGRCGQ
jgi:hypothetical protein